MSDVSDMLDMAIMGCALVVGRLCTSGVSAYFALPLSFGCVIPKPKQYPEAALHR
jgi:hypothetical protein